MVWSSESYFNKAHLYWVKATNQERDSQDFLFNMALSVEFIIRGALCSVNPCLNASTDEESLLYAVGSPQNRPPKTVNIKMGLLRLERLLPEITKSEKDVVSTLIELRNQELHSDEEAFITPNAQDFLPNVFSFMVRVAEDRKIDLSVLLTEADAKQAKKFSEAISKNRSKRVKELIKIQKDRFFALPKDEQDNLRKKNNPSFTSAVMANGFHLVSYPCPSCKNNGMILGEPVGSSNPIMKDDNIFREIRTIPRLFECKCCDLKIKGLDEIIAAKIPNEFNSRDEVDAIDHFNIDVMEYVDTDEIIREYQFEDEYMDE